MCSLYVKVLFKDSELKGTPTPSKKKVFLELFQVFHYKMQEKEKLLLGKFEKNEKNEKKDNLCVNKILN